MSRIRGRDTRPELVVRRIVHRLGYRYRLHQADLPGKPDVVLPRHRKIIEVRGCFFHMHKCQLGLVQPATRAELWKTKRLSNVDRDKRNLRLLRKMGWRVLVIWECELKEITKIEQRLQDFLEQKSP